MSRHLNKEDIFKNDNIQEWKSEQDRIPAMIQKKQQLIQEEQSSIALLKPRQQELSQQIAPLDNRIAELTLDLVILAVQEYKTIKILKPIEVKDAGGYSRTIMQEVEEKIIDPAIAMIIAAKERERFELEQLKRPLAKEKSNIDEDINNHNSIISQTQQKINALQKRFQHLIKLIDKAKTFLDQLKNQPELLMKNLYQSIQQQLAKYEDAHLMGQPHYIRQHIAEIQLHLSAIQRNESDFFQQYHLVCGLLANIFRSLEQIANSENNTFYNMIYSLLSNAHIEIDGDFPDKLNKTDEPCRTHYCRLYPRITPDAFQMYEENQYEIASRQFLDQLNKIHPVTKDLANLIATGKAMTHEIEQQKNIDIKFSTSILAQSTQLLQNPKHKTAEKMLCKCASLASGHPSTMKKVGGVLLAFLGATLFVASILCPPFLGVASIIAAPTGALTLLGGMGLFGDGMRKGLSKNIKNFTERCNDQPLENNAILPYAPPMPA